MENFVCLSMLKHLEEICYITLFCDLFPFSQSSLTAESLKVQNWISGCCKQAWHYSDFNNYCSEGETSYLSWGVAFPCMSVLVEDHWLIHFKLATLFPGWWDLFIHWELLPSYIEANELPASLHTLQCAVSPRSLHLGTHLILCLCVEINIRCAL